MSRIRVLHVIPQLSLGGAGRGLISLARASKAIGGFEHIAVSLNRPDPAALLDAQSAGMSTLPLASVDALIASADIVQIHFWNEPGMDRFLRRPLPDRRLLLWAHVRGTNAPQALTRSVVGLASHVVASHPASLQLPALARLAKTDRASLIPAGADPERLTGIRRSRSRVVRVGYLGSLDFAKLHEEFVAWSCAIQGPIRIVLGGEGPDRKALEREARRHGMANRFEFLGFVKDIREFFGGIDILGHALTPHSYATSETVVAEAMLAGVPPVVLSEAGGAFLVRHRRTGLIVKDGPSYARAIEELAGDSQFRLRLGHAAKDWAARHLTNRTCALKFHRLYEALLKAPKARHPESAPPSSGALAFEESLGVWGRPFRESLDGGPRAAAADRKIARSSPGLASASSGGIVHYRLAYPDDPHLALWSGLVFEHRGRLALAAAEYARAARSSEAGRAQEYLARVLSRMPLPPDHAAAFRGNTFGR
jgi:glycosyltransferase involved in cell wall biosynthesis